MDTNIEKYIREELKKSLTDMVRTVYVETQITVYQQLQNLLSSAMNLSFPYDEGLSMRKATSEERLNFIINGLTQIINATKECAEKRETK